MFDGDAMLHCFRFSNGKVMAYANTWIRSARFKNNDATNFIEVGGDSGLTVFKLKVLPGESILITPSSATMYYKADTATCNVFVVAVDS